MFENIPASKKQINVCAVGNVYVLDSKPLGNLRNTLFEAVLFFIFEILQYFFCFYWFARV